MKSEDWMQRMLKNPFSYLGFVFLTLMIFVTVFSIWPSPDFSFKWHAWLVGLCAVIGFLVFVIFCLGIKYLWEYNKQHKEKD
jgi:hypothetical protein